MRFSLSSTTSLEVAAALVVALCTLSSPSTYSYGGHGGILLVQAAEAAAQEKVLLIGEELPVRSHLEKDNDNDNDNGHANANANANQQLHKQTRFRSRSDNSRRKKSNSSNALKTRGIGFETRNRNGNNRGFQNSRRKQPPPPLEENESLSRSKQGETDDSTKHFAVDDLETLDLFYDNSVAATEKSGPSEQPETDNFAADTLENLDEEVYSAYHDSSAAAAAATKSSLHDQQPDKKTDDSTQNNFAADDLETFISSLYGPSEPQPPETDSTTNNFAAADDPLVENLVDKEEVYSYYDSSAAAKSWLNDQPETNLTNFAEDALETLDSFYYDNTNSEKKSSLSFDSTEAAPPPSSYSSTSTTPQTGQDSSSISSSSSLAEIAEIVAKYDTVVKLWESNRAKILEQITLENQQHVEALRHAFEALAAEASAYCNDDNTNHQSTTSSTSSSEQQQQQLATCIELNSGFQQIRNEFILVSEEIAAKNAKLLHQDSTHLLLERMDGESAQQQVQQVLQKATTTTTTQEEAEAAAIAIATAMDQKVAELDTLTTQVNMQLEISNYEFMGYGCFALHGVTDTLDANDHEMQSRLYHFASSAIQDSAAKEGQVVKVLSAGVTKQQLLVVDDEDASNRRLRRRRERGRGLFLGSWGGGRSSYHNSHSSAPSYSSSLWLMFSYQYKCCNCGGDGNPISDVTRRNRNRNRNRKLVEVAGEELPEEFRKQFNHPANSMLLAMGVRTMIGGPLGNLYSIEAVPCSDL